MRYRKGEVVVADLLQMGGVYPKLEENSESVEKRAKVFYF